MTSWWSLSPQTSVWSTKSLYLWTCKSTSGVQSAVNYQWYAWYRSPLAWPFPCSLPPDCCAMQGICAVFIAAMQQVAATCNSAGACLVVML